MIGLYVEGGNDLKTIPKLIRRIPEVSRIGIKGRIVPRGDMFSIRKMEARIRFLQAQHRHLSKVIICVDSHSHCEETIRRVGEIETALCSSGLHLITRYCVIVHALESWLVSDLAALGSILGTKPKVRFTNPETVCNPKDLLADIFGRRGKEYDYLRDNPRIAACLDPNVVAKNNKSFAYFRDLVRDT